VYPGCAHRESPESRRHIALRTFEDDIDVQVRREALGGWMNLDLYQKGRSIYGKHNIFRNDCQSGLFGLQKGSRSLVIQFAANSESMHRGRRVSLLSARVRRALDRGRIGRRQPTACGKRLLNKIYSFAELLGLTLTG
jgi:hypothetical protein